MIEKTAWKDVKFGAWKFQRFALCLLNRNFPFPLAIPLAWETDIRIFVTTESACWLKTNRSGRLKVLGRLASQISTVVQGKDKPTYAPNWDKGDMCIVINAKDVCVTGRKLTDKYIGHLKERSLKDQMAKDPTEVIRKAVLRMLPRNKLRDDRDRKLRIFAGSEHPFGDRPLEPYVMPPRQVREMRPRARRAMIRAQKKAEQQQGGATVSKMGKRKEVEAAEDNA
nr:uncharacterized protein LOC109163898 [Ipomoea trifida]